jgi:hypothetical protein
LDDIPLDRLPTGIKWQLETNVVANRTARGEYAAAQELLDQIYDSTDAGNLRQLLDMLQADIYFRQEKLKEAAKLYNALLKSSSGAAVSAGGDFLRKRYAEIENKLGSE